LGVRPLVSEKPVAFAAGVAIWDHEAASRDRSSWNPVSLEELSIHERSIRLRETPVAVRLLGAAGSAPGVGVGVLVGVAVGGTGVEVGVGVRVAVEGTGVAVGVRVAVGVAVGAAGVEVAVGVRVAVGGTGVEVGVGAAPFRIVKESSIAPVSRRNFASRRFPSTSSTIEPSWLREMNIAGWLSAPPLAWPELPATV
jgi:hypothetical protein